jgi:hypothetical protein
MLRYAAEDFWKASEVLATLAGFPLLLSHPNGRANVTKAVNELLENCEKLKLKISLREAEKMLPSFNNPSTSPDRIQQMAAHLSSVIHSELDGELFFQMEASKIDYWHPAWLMDRPLYAAFPRAHQEMQSAGRCYAYGEPTACVFHLMRVIDAGLRSVANSLQVNYDARNWSGITDKIEKEMGKKYPDKSEDWKKSEPFYASVLTDIQAISRAHRNPALHEIERKYTDSDAYYLITVVERFMGHLAENGMREKMETA